MVKADMKRGKKMNLETIIAELGDNLLSIRKVPTDKGVIWAVDTDIEPIFCFSDNNLNTALSNALMAKNNPIKELHNGCRIQIVLNETDKPIHRVVSVEDDAIYFCNEEDYQKAISNNTWPGAIGFVRKTEKIIVLDD